MGRPSARDSSTERSAGSMSGVARVPAADTVSAIDQQRIDPPLCSGMHTTTLFSWPAKRLDVHIGHDAADPAQRDPNAHCQDSAASQAERPRRLVAVTPSSPVISAITRRAGRPSSIVLARCFAARTLLCDGEPELARARLGKHVRRERWLQELVMFVFAIGESEVVAIRVSTIQRVAGGVSDEQNRTEPAGGVEQVGLWV